MKRVFLLIVVPAMLVAMGFAQTPAASGNTDQVNLKGCLGGSDGNYTVAEDNTGKIFKITSSSADLKAHVGHDVSLIGHKADAENTLAVTELNMISEHCTAAAAAPAANVSAPAETSSTLPAAAVAPAAAAPAATVTSPSETVSTPPAAAADAAAPAAAASDAIVSSPPETIIERPTPAEPAVVGAPASAVSSPAETASAPAAAAAVHRTRPSARPQKPAATPAAAPESAEPVSQPVADAPVPVAPVGQPAETASTPAAPAAAPKTSAIRSAGMLVTIAVVLLIGAGIPLYNRWRRRKLSEETRGQNLSFTKEAKSDPGKSDTTGGHKAA
jgi:hypothetical protein